MTKVSQEDSKSIDTVSSTDLSLLQTSTTNYNDTINNSKNISDNDNLYSYVELLALYENERNYRTTCNVFFIYFLTLEALVEVFLPVLLINILRSIR